MGFSAEDGLFLACFLAVIIVLAGAIRFFCRRFCGVRCSRCAHKQDPAGPDQQIPSVIVDTHRPGDSVLVCLQQHPQQNELLTAVNDGTGNSSASVYLCPPKRDSGLPRRGSNNSMVAVPSMQTLYEEEENDESQEEPVRPTPGSTSRNELGVVSTIYHFTQNNQSPELTRTNGTSTSIERSMSLSSEMELRSTIIPINDHPPSYEDLFPSEEELTSYKPKNNPSKRSSCSKL